MRIAWLLLSIAPTLAVVAACGARSELYVPPGEGSLADAGPDVVIDAPDIPSTSCADAGVQYIYVITNDQTLYAFDTSTNAFHGIGKVQCGTGNAFSMAVDRAGHSYVEVEGSSSSLWLVDLVDATCQPTRFASQQFQKFGMAFVADTTDTAETLFIATPNDLGSVDTSTFDVTEVGPFSKGIGKVELTGTGDGRFFAFGVRQNQAQAHLAEIDRTNAAVLSDQLLPLGNVSDWAFAAYGGVFYFFTSKNGEPSEVNRYNPALGTLDTVAHADGPVVGAGVSTCAPTH